MACPSGLPGAGESLVTVRRAEPGQLFGWRLPGFLGVGDGMMQPLEECPFSLLYICREIKLKSAGQHSATLVIQSSIFMPKFTSYYLYMLCYVMLCTCTCTCVSMVLF